MGWPNLPLTRHHLQLLTALCQEVQGTVLVLPETLPRISRQHFVVTLRWRIMLPQSWRQSRAAVLSGLRQWSQLRGRIHFIFRTYGRNQAAAIFIMRALAGGTRGWR